MDGRREALETIVGLIDPSTVEELRRIDNLSPVERKVEYMNICDRINKGRKDGKCSRSDVRRVKDIMAQVYDIHPNSNDIGIVLNLLAIAAIVGYCSYRFVINPLIEYFSK